MFSSLIKRIFGQTKEDTGNQKSNAKALSAKEEVEAQPAALKETKTPPKTKPSYRAQIKEKYDFDLPPSDTDKVSMGKSFERNGELEKACACYEGCLKNRFDGNAPYDRLIIVYRKLERPKDVERVIKRAITVFDKVAKQGRSDGTKKLAKYQAKLEKLRQA
jgi:tetratricopeptide (TPR) repeat protein